MMKWMVFAAALLLAGCGEDMEGWVPGLAPARQRPASPVAPPTPTVPVAAEADSYCRGVAHQRMQDGKTFDYDRDMLKAIYDDAYRECIAWRTPRTR